MLNEFRNFIAKGNVMDMAVGIIIGAAFTAIVKSMVGDLINPIISLFIGGIDFTNWFYVLGGGEYPTLAEARDAGAGGVGHGLGHRAPTGARHADPGWRRSSVDHP